MAPSRNDGLLLQCDQPKTCTDSVFSTLIGGRSMIAGVHWLATVKQVRRASTTSSEDCAVRCGERATCMIERNGALTRRQVAHHAHAFMPEMPHCL